MHINHSESWHCGTSVMFRSHGSHARPFNTVRACSLSNFSSCYIIILLLDIVTLTYTSSCLSSSCDFDTQTNDHTARMHAILTRLFNTPFNTARTHAPLARSVRFLFMLYHHRVTSIDSVRHRDAISSHCIITLLL
jgi:hypothetical protein